MVTSLARSLQYAVRPETFTSRSPAIFHRSVEGDWLILNMHKRALTRSTLLLVEDDEAARTTFAAVLVGAGYRVVEAGNGIEGFEMAERENPALILLDVDMPKANGWQTLERLRKSGFSRPIIMLTGHTQIDDRVRGLSAGADDYLCKPCDHRELIARVHSALRRCQPVVSEIKILHFGRTRLDLKNRTATREGEPVELTRTEYAMLELFARHPGKLVTRELMLESIWGYARQPNTRTVDTHIWRLRQKLEDHANQPQWIQTMVAGGGYRMVCDGLAVD